MGKVTGVVLAALAQQLFDAAKTETIQLIDGAQHRHFLIEVRWIGGTDADLLQNTVKHLAVIELDHVLTARDAELFQRVSHQHAGFRVSSHIVGTDGVGIELHELAEAARARLLVAEDVAVVIAAERFG